MMCLDRESYVSRERDMMCLERESYDVSRERAMMCLERERVMMCAMVRFTSKVRLREKAKTGYRFSYRYDSQIVLGLVSM